MIGSRAIGGSLQDAIYASRSLHVNSSSPVQDPHGMISASSMSGTPTFLLIFVFIEAAILFYLRRTTRHVHGG